MSSETAKICYDPQGYAGTDYHPYRTAKQIGSLNPPVEFFLHTNREQDTDAAKCKQFPDFMIGNFYAWELWNAVNRMKISVS